MTAENEVEHVGHLDIHDAQKALISSLELALVEDLDRDDRRVLDGPAIESAQPKQHAWHLPRTYTSKLSFQYGLSVFLMTLVVWVCSASTVITANGSGNLKTSRFDRPSAATTVLRC